MGRSFLIYRVDGADDSATKYPLGISDSWSTACDLLVAYLAQRWPGAEQIHTDMDADRLKHKRATGFEFPDDEIHWSNEHKIAILGKKRFGIESYVTNGELK